MFPGGGTVLRDKFIVQLSIFREYVSFQWGDMAIQKKDAVLKCISLDNRRAFRWCVAIKRPARPSRIWAVKFKHCCYIPVFKHDILSFLISQAQKIHQDCGATCFYIQHCDYSIYIYIYRSSFLQYFLSFLPGLRGWSPSLTCPAAPRSCIVIRHWGPGEENRWDVEKPPPTTVDGWNPANLCWNPIIYDVFFSHPRWWFLKHQQYDYYQWSWISNYQNNPQHNY